MSSEGIWNKYFSNKLNQELHLKSILESKALRLLDFNETVWSYDYEPKLYRIKYYDTEENRWRIYTPDVLITLVDNSEILLEIKPSSKLKDQNNIDKWSAAIPYCDDIRTPFRVITELNFPEMEANKSFNLYNLLIPEI